MKLAAADNGQLAPSRAEQLHGKASWVELLAMAGDPSRECSQRSGDSAWFRIGDRRLQLVSDANFVEEFRCRYRGCETAPPEGPDDATIRCEATVLARSLLSLTFEGAGLADPLLAVGTPFRMLRHLDHVEAAGPVGWRILVERGSGRLVAASDGRRLVVALESAPPDFASDCVASVVQASQNGVMFLHAASVGVAGSGALLIAGGRRGKSTTALALAARGHAFLGDDMAAVRTESCELLPFRKVASLRPGAFVRSFAERLRVTPHAITTAPDGEPRTLVHMADLFPTAQGKELPLRYAFLLDGFGPRPRLSPYRPDISDARRLRGAVSESLPHWGVSPARDLMKFLAVVNLLSRIECHLLELGTPQETAATIEALMEGRWH